MILNSTVIPMVAFCELCDTRTPVCEECYDANWVSEVECAYCHGAYGHDMDQGCRTLVIGFD